MFCLQNLIPSSSAENHGHFLESVLLKQLLSDWFLLVPFVFSANQEAFVICTRVTSLHSYYTFCTGVTEELHSFLSQSELSNFFVYIISVDKKAGGKAPIKISYL